MRLRIVSLPQKFTSTQPKRLVAPRPNTRWDSLRYDLSKLRAKGLVQRLDKSRRYRLTSEGYRICVVYLKLFEKLYAPLINGILKPFKDDARLQNNRRRLDDR